MCPSWRILPKQVSPSNTPRETMVKTGEFHSHHPCVTSRPWRSLTSGSGTVGSCKSFQSFLGMTFMGISWVTMRLLLDTDNCQEKDHKTFSRRHQKD